MRVLTRLDLRIREYQHGVDPSFKKLLAARRFPAANKNWAETGGTATDKKVRILPPPRKESTKAFSDLGSQFRLQLTLN